MSESPPDPGAEDLQGLAGEYVLGTLDLPRRLEVQQRLQHDEALRIAVEAWERRLLPLTALAPVQTPSALLWKRIERSLHPAERKAGWWDSLPVWRGIAAAGLAASVVMAALLLSRVLAVSTPQYLVVLVAPQDQAPGWVVQASNAREVELIPLAVASLPDGKALEFWTKADGWQGPVSLGLVKPGQSLRIALDTLPPLQANQLFELTLENSGGSTVGRPTGPVQFIGRAVRLGQAL
jgi:anti-sigma-K factor RskA